MIRTVIFWTHLAAGLAAGLVILVMSATGVALTYERQLIASTVGHLRTVPPSTDAPLPLETVLRHVAEAHPGISPTGVTLLPGADTAIVVQAEPSPLYVDARTARVIGTEPLGGLRGFLATMRNWHRWLAREGEGRTVGRAITGWSNLLFLFIVVSGLYLWMPRSWSWPHLRPITLFKRSPGSGKARDFNWHHVIGFWTAIPLAIIVFSALPISFPWASDLVYRIVGEEPPVRRSPESGTMRARSADPAGSVGTRNMTPTNVPGEPSSSAAMNSGWRFAGLDAAVATVAAEQRDWRSLIIRLPHGADEPFTVTLDRGTGGQPQLRQTLTLDRRGRVTARESFADQALGRRVRSLLRFAHTGEVAGLPGQTIAGIASAGVVVMVWTGLALSWRRYRHWSRSRSRRASSRVRVDKTGIDRAISDATRENYQY